MKSVDYLQAHTCNNYQTNSNGKLSQRDKEGWMVAHYKHLLFVDQINIIIYVVNQLYFLASKITINEYYSRLLIKNQLKING